MQSWSGDRDTTAGDPATLGAPPSLAHPGPPAPARGLDRRGARPRAGHQHRRHELPRAVLAQAGLVEDTGPGDGRSRVWAAARADERDGVDTSVAVSAIDDADELADALWLAHDVVDHHAQRQHGWIDAQVARPLVWQEECGIDDREVLVDETQLAALRAELGAVLDRYRRRGAGTPGARRVSAVVALTPLPRRS
ncbi:ArsR family transcriptional regulator [Janibacter limosus]|uniref:ArsR family transcriptional regulator n=1 Tax=Janibacter limosus TaxID=53458 RepID=UPI0035D8D779|nr:ArsR family transcriptional regulator [Janibacter limosus]